MLAWPLKIAIISMIHTVAYAELLSLSIVATQRTRSQSSWLQRTVLAFTIPGDMSRLHSSWGKKICKKPDQLFVNTIVPHIHFFPVVKHTESPHLLVLALLPSRSVLMESPDFLSSSPKKDSLETCPHERWASGGRHQLKEVEGTGRQLKAQRRS